MRPHQHKEMRANSSKQSEGVYVRPLLHEGYALRPVDGAVVSTADRILGLMARAKSNRYAKYLKRCGISVDERSCPRNKRAKIWLRRIEHTDQLRTYHPSVAGVENA